ncbi:MAG TPA: tyrosine--tRNA ligase, partial [Anaerolineaceae bacterium]|nr:tyrosine--tRNA ligase [Anaerolineaceae bacterium]
MNIDEQVNYLMRGAEYGDQQVFDAMADELRERLIESEKTGVPLKVYCGFDPTSSDLHLGHTVPLRKLAQFQELGHDVTFVIGTFTALIGDPSARDKSRPLVGLETILENAKTYQEQAFRVLDPEKTRIVYNGDWLNNIPYHEIFNVLTNFTIQQMLSREGLQKRWESNEPIYLHEMLYPITQGLDAHHLEADVQVGGTDQLYNVITASRKVMQSYGQRPNIGILMPLLPGTDGVQKMSKSLGNYIPINTTAEDMYGKVMSIPDDVMAQYAKLVTKWSSQELYTFLGALETNSIHPRDAKMQLAYAITSAFYGDSLADEAENRFVTTFQKGDIPDEMPEVHLEAGKHTVLDVLVDQGL